MTLAPLRALRLAALLVAFSPATGAAEPPQYAVTPPSLSPAGVTIVGHGTVGTGPEAILVMHEWMGDHSNYAGLLPFLNGKDFTYVFADLRGYGWSRDLAGAYTADEAAADMFALMDRLGHQRFHVVGHSMSGLIAQAMAAKGRDRLKSLVAVTPVPASGFKTDEAGLQRLAAIVDADDAMRGAIKARVAQRYTDGWVDYKLAIARNATGREAMLGYLKMFTGTDVSAEVAGLDLPVLLITGADDIPFYQEAAERPKFEQAYKNLTVERIENAGHYPMLQTPPLLLAKIEAFVAANAKAKPGN
ncbi:alpha/beta fold hydrolase [Azospirillum rugosum]|uniref:Pimeloyl-ACP methyl ester carboxylesterase n=1 Tax=Azospirillum rugosum TaxID=416170 RepID=A0ABS4STT4_9PROT|nr:alpha/beta hydrolase [Azospirillum rugosum]MBP2295980.1 pimeloyl-ACP methyl ester carboxylesterase [Azospirillum rugosum]MDQ0529570.1 pimeloyl-ACP methyl ester carboxylesterase [Azospirillum rugosum]